MSKISLYIGKEYLLYFLTCLTSTIIIFSTFVVLGEVQLLNEPGGWNLFVSRMLSSIPGMFETIIPITVLLATVLTLISLSRRSEIIAMMAAGISVRQLVQPILIIGLVISSFYYFNQSYLTRWWGQNAQISLYANRDTKNQWMFYRGELFFLKNLNKKKKEITQAKIFSFDNKNNITRMRQVKGLSLKEGSWVSKESDDYIFTNKGVQTTSSPKKSIHRDNFPIVFKPDLLNPKYSPLEAILENLVIRQQSGISFQDILFAAYQKIASILTIFIMILLGLPFSLFSGRDSNVRTGIVISVILGFVYWLLEQILVSFFVAGVFSAELSAFGTNTLFLALAFYFIQTKRQ
ncbi:MAG: LptF/LptG family permease [Proteobacteria bacterium]|nr:LptF/LptG family permease [Pseudomonadota bacterium]